MHISNIILTFVSMNKLALAISIASRAFEKTLDKGGHPYILHCMRVMSAIIQAHPNDEELAQIAILHDVPEDFPKEWPTSRLRELGFSDRVCRVLDILNHDPKDDYESVYIVKVSLDDDATAVKLKDIEDNSQMTRIKGVGKKDFDRVQKYIRVYQYLSRK